MSYSEIRKKAEDAGYHMDDDTFGKVVAYAKRKAATSGKGDSYIPCVLPDVIREHFARIAINSFSTELMKIQSGG